jgi:hypothetical protein
MGDSSSPLVQEVSCATVPGSAPCSSPCWPPASCWQANSAFAPQAGAESAIEPLAVCRDGIRFLLFADWYPAGTTGSEDEAPVLVQSVQAATPVPAADASGRITPPADTLMLDTTVNVPYTPQLVDFSTVAAPPTFAKYPPHVTLSWPYPQPVGLQKVNYVGEYTLRWDHKLKAGPRAVVLSFDRFDLNEYSAEFVADVDKCHLFNGNHPRTLARSSQTVHNDTSLKHA